VSSQDKTVLPIVVIDPGHGGSDKGAIGINGIQEKDIALNVAMEILRLNRQLCNNALEIYSTRYTDTLISLKQRGKLANALKADIFVSIHCNKASRRAARGLEVYICKSNAHTDGFARLIAKEAKKKLGIENRGVKNGNFQVLHELEDAVGVLLELCFLSNFEEAKHIVRQSSISAYALLILDTILKYYDHD